VEYSLKTTKAQQFVDITGLVNKAVSESGVEDGIAVVFVPHTTAGVIELDGISHFVFPEHEGFMEYLDVATALKQSVDADAIGVIPFKTIKDDTYSIRPFVHVKKVNTNVFERGCGSGSLALGMYLDKVFGMSKRIEVVQPGGIIGVEMGSEYSISTDVVFTCEGIIMV
jgi:diaminopimelate epimerase